MSTNAERTLDKITASVNNDSALLHRGRYVDLTFLLGLGAEDFLITIVKGRISEVRPRTLATDSGVFSIRASLQHWQKFWLAVPPRDYQDLFSMLPKQYAIIDGDLLPLMQNLQYFKDVLACGRETEAKNSSA